MLQSKLFTKTRKEPPAEEVAKNAKLLIQAGFIHKEMAGVYSYLPLGLKVRENISKIIRDEMDKAGGQEIELSTLQDKGLWQETDRWSDEAVDVWFKTALKNGSDMGLGFTHEEPLTTLMKNHISSYTDLPIYPYQIQTKFRNEVRAKSGLLRGREFLMKDLYSFSRSEEEHDEFYEEMKTAYHNIFDRAGIGEETFITFASGGSFSEFSHEFQTLTDAGEDTIYLDRDKEIAVNKEVYTDDVLDKLNLDKSELEEHTAAEVGNIFSLGTRFSDALDLTYKDEDGEENAVVMGSYGIGVGRLMATVVEVLADEDGLVWPRNLSPYTVHLLSIGDSKEVQQEAKNLYESLKEKGISVLFDDRSVSPGEKFADADLIGIPNRIVISENTIEEGKVEIKERTEEAEELISEDALYDRLS